MDPADFQMEMDLSGQIELYHPDHPHCFYIIEQKLDHESRFLQEYLIFYTSPLLTRATQESLDTDRTTVMAFIDRLLGEGWKNIDGDIFHEIPKFNRFKKWQLCPQIRL